MLSAELPRPRRENVSAQEVLARAAEQKPAQEPPKPAAGEGKAVSTKVAAGGAPLAFQHSKNPVGIPASLENATVAIKMLGLDCRYDLFHDRIIVRECKTGVPGDEVNNLENITLKVRQLVLGRFGFDPSSQFTYDALKLRCLDNQFDPVRDYLDGLRWDGRPRLDGWLIRYCGAEDTKLNRAIGRKMLVGAVRRVRSPGCKFDYIVVLESRRQGMGKSTLLRILAGDDNFSDNEIMGLDKKEQQEAVQGIWMYEIAELEGMHKSDVTKIKLFASKTVDSARPAYARSRVDRARRGIFVATTNEETYLRDTTGNRRFWPVLLHGVVRAEDGSMLIDLAGVQRDRDQLWAEACQAEATGEALVIPESLWPDVEAEQEARMELDPWEDELACEMARLTRWGTNVEGSFIMGAEIDGSPEWRVATDYLLTDVLDLPRDRQNNNHTKRLAGIMRNLGWTSRKDAMWFGQKQKRGYSKRCDNLP